MCNWTQAAWSDSLCSRLRPSRPAGLLLLVFFTPPIKSRGEKKNSGDQFNQFGAVHSQAAVESCCAAKVIWLERILKVWVTSIRPLCFVPVSHDCPKKSILIFLEAVHLALCLQPPCCVVGPLHVLEGPTKRRRSKTGGEGGGVVLATVN